MRELELSALVINETFTHHHYSVPKRDNAVSQIPSRVGRSTAAHLFRLQKAERQT